MKKVHVMLDLETLGTKPGCPILSIGACTFSADIHHVAYNFYVRIGLKCYQYFRQFKPDMETMQWWEHQGQEARDEAFEGDTGLLQALGQFDQFLWKIREDAKMESGSQEYPEICIWGNGAGFDNEILRAAYEMTGNHAIPWNFRNDRCFRTLKNLLATPTGVKFEGTKHNALHDARYQAQIATEIIHTLQDMNVYLEEF